VVASDTRVQLPKNPRIAQRRIMALLRCELSTILGNAGQTSQSLALVVGDAALVEGGAELG
jgi:hypothetical protein